MNQVEKNKKKFFGLREKTDSYLMEDGSQNQKAKGRKNCLIKNKNSIKSIRENHNKFIKNNKLILKTC